MIISIEDLMIWVLGISIIGIGLLRILSRWRQKSSDSRQRKDVIYCNVCVKYSQDNSGDKIVCCSGCGRELVRGRNRSLG